MNDLNNALELLDRAYVILDTLDFIDYEMPDEDIVNDIRQFLAKHDIPAGLYR